MQGPISGIRQFSVKNRAEVKNQSYGDENANTSRKRGLKYHQLAKSIKKQRTCRA
jgi:hypothetical protein